MKDNRFSLNEEELIAWDQIIKADTIVITTHIHPDGDAIGSALAMLLYCKTLGKNVSVIIDDNIPDIFSFLKNYSAITNPASVHRIEADLLIIIDTNIKRIGRVGDGKYKSILNIDHHETNPGQCDFSIIRGDISSTAELLYFIYKSMNYTLDKEMSEYLYTGLITDSVYFKALGVSAESFEIAAELVRHGADSGMIAEKLEMKSLWEMKQVSLALSEMRDYSEGKIVGVILDERYDELELTDVIIDTLRYIRGGEVAFLLKHEKKGGYRVRVRSQMVDVGQFAKMNGGGGHSDAAGFTIDASDGEEAEKIFIGRLKEWREQFSG